MCIGLGEAELMETDCIEAVQDELLKAYNTWKENFGCELNVSEELLVDTFLTDVKDLILSKG
jgi:hypothetical protein